MYRAGPVLPEGRHVALPGVNLWYRDSGGDGPAVIMMHAATGNADAWLYQYGPLSRAGFRVLAFDRRGWGRSQPAAGDQPGTVAGDLEALADHLGLDKFALTGMAAGGHAALDYAAWRPERLSCLALAGTSCLIQEEDFLAFLERIEIPGLKALSPAYRELGASYRGLCPEGVEAWLEMEENSRQEGAQVQFPRTPNTYGKVAGVNVPALVIVPGGDIICPPALMEMWWRHLPQREVVTIPAAGHAPQWEYPDAFNAALLAFLTKHTAPGAS